MMYNQIIIIGRNNNWNYLNKYNLSYFFESIMVQINIIGDIWYITTYNCYQKL